MLEGNMLDRWSAISSHSEYLQHILKNLLSDRAMDLDGFLMSRETQQAFLTAVFPEMLTALEHNTTSGLFMILANNAPLTEASRYMGFFLRDSDPYSKNYTNSDLLFERGNKDLARSASIALDSGWASQFSLMGSGVRASDDFFYKPLMAAAEHPEAESVNLGYWSAPFILENAVSDNHQMVTYSLPLRLDGRVYGVLGVEVSVSMLIASLPLRELDPGLCAGSALVRREADGTFTGLLGTGVLYETAGSGPLTFTPVTPDGMYAVEGAGLGDTQIYAMTTPLTLYSRNVPYHDTDLHVAVFVTGTSIYSAGDDLYNTLTTIMLLSGVIGMLIAALIARSVSMPVMRLMRSIRGGYQSLKEFGGSNIREVDELHRVVLDLTENERKINASLAEEKERYRIAVESSSDMFFTYQASDGYLQMISGGNIRNRQRQFTSEELARTVAPENQAQLIEKFSSEPGPFMLELRMRMGSEPRYHWYRLQGNVVATEDMSRKFIGYCRDIDAEKERGSGSGDGRSIDPVTSFWQYAAGLEAIAAARRLNAGGCAVRLSVRDFAHLADFCGLLCSDVIMGELSRMAVQAVSAAAPKGFVGVRCSADSLLLWLPGIYDGVTALLEELSRSFADILTHTSSVLSFNAGMAVANEGDDFDAVLKRAEAALACAKAAAVPVHVWHPADGTAAPASASGIVTSTFIPDQMSMSSLAVNLFDRMAGAYDILDLLFPRLNREYSAANLLVISFRHDYLSGHISYAHTALPGWDMVLDSVKCSESEYTAILEAAEAGSLTVAGASPAEKALFLPLGIPETTPVLHMLDGSEYIGSILLPGAENALKVNEETVSQLQDVCAVIRSRFIREHHDLSAKAKANFLARMSHEIRTPMNGIIGMTEIGLREGQTEASRIDCLKKVKNSSVYLLGLLNDILDMSKIESGKMQLNEADFDLKRVIDDISSLLEVKFSEKDQTYTPDIRLEHSCFRGDELRINQVLINLLGNAIKYTPEGGHISLTVTEAPGGPASSSVTFTVTDDGVGISQRDQTRIFSSFEQVENANGHQQGTGLGLSISNKLIHMMGSSIRLVSEPGKGSTFSFTLALPHGEARCTQNDDGVSELNFSGYRILVAEDNELNMEIITTILEDYGIECTCCSSGREAVDAFSSSEPGTFRLILMDIMMPEMNGLDAAHAIRSLSHPDAASVAIVAMSANAFDEDVQRSLASGMNAHLSKPVDIRKLENVLSRFLR